MKKILFITLLLISTISTPVYAKDKEIKVMGSMVYEIQPNGEIIITGYYGKEENVVIPDMIAGHLVTGIAENTFTETSVKNLTIPETVTNFDRAFDDEIKVKTVSGGTIEQQASSDSSNTQDNSQTSSKEEKTNNKEESKNNDSKGNSNEEVDLSYLGDDEGVGIFDASEKYDETDISQSEEEINDKEETNTDSNNNEKDTETNKPKFTFVSFICCVLTVAFVLFAPQLKYLQKIKK